MQNSPIWISRKWFDKIETIFRALIWKGGTPRIRLQTLQLPTREGGMAVPHPRSYFLAAQLQYIGGNSKENLIIMGAPHKTVIETLEADSFIYNTPTVKLIKKAWRTVKNFVGNKWLD